MRPYSLTHSIARRRRALVAALAAGALVATSGAFAAAAPPPGTGTSGTGTPASGASADGGPGGAGPTQGDGANAAAGPAAAFTVTLITGDVVTVTDLADGTQTVDVAPADPASPVQVLQADGEVVVIPASALPYLAAESLDPGLFNVTKLIEYGFDDAAVDATPVIVEFAAAVPAAAHPVEGLDLTTPLPSIAAIAGGAERAVATESWQQLTASTARGTGSAEPGEFTRGIETIHLDRPVRALLDQSVPYIDAPQAWELGFDGAGSTVAVLDTGIDAEHPDLVDAIAITKSFVPGENVDDYNGHGTHVASTVAGRGTASDGQFTGVAPGAELAIGKVLDNSGFGLTSWIIEGMEWGAANADVVSMSLGTDEPTDGLDILSESLNAITAETDVLFVVAAGNFGFPGTIGAPGSAQGALTIGSVDAELNERSFFSSQGPVMGTGALKPDVSAPGSNITAAAPQYLPWIDGPYQTMDGTSMATPHVAGAAAIALQADPTLSAPELKNLLASSARDLGFTPYQGGTGVVDVLSAVENPVFASGMADFGMLAWGESAEQLEREVVFVNRSDEDLTLDLELEVGITDLAGVVSDDDDAAPAMVLDQSEVTVPAFGTATVTLTGDPGLLGAGDELSGALVASLAEEPVTRTAIGMIVESERYDLTVRAIGIDGEPTVLYPFLFDLDNSYPTVIGVDGESTLRLGAGTYSVMAFAEVPQDEGNPAIALLGNPDVVLDRGREVVLDMRDALPVTVEVPGVDGLVAEAQRMEYRVNGLAGSMMVPELMGPLLAAPVTTATVDFDFTTRWRLREPRVSLALGDLDLQPFTQVAVPDPEGDLAGLATYLGDGGSAAVAGVDLAGGIAVMLPSDDVSAPERAAAAAGAGASLLVVAQDEAFYEYYGQDDGSLAPIPVVSVWGAAAAALLVAVSEAPVELTGLGAPNAADIYDVVLYEDGSIPPNPTKVADDLALIETTYHGTESALFGEFRYDFTPGAAVGSGGQLSAWRPGVRNEWVSTTDVEWYQDVYEVDLEWDVRGARRTYEAGEELVHGYFGPIIRPFVGPGFWAPYREGDSVQLNVPGWADGGGSSNTGSINLWSEPPGFSMWGEIYVDGELVVSSPYQAPSYWSMPEQETRVRFVTETESDPELLGTSVYTWSEWEFDTAVHPEWVAEVLPLIQAYYGVETAVDGTAGVGRAAGEPVALEIEVGHLAGAAGAEELTEVAAAFSLDGGDTWSDLDLSELPPGPEAGADAGDPGEGSFGGVFVDRRQFVRSFAAQVPVSDEGGEISLRLTAADGAENTFAQEIITAVKAAAAEPGATASPTVSPTGDASASPTGGTDGPTGGTDGPTGGTDGPTGGTDGPTGGTDGPTDASPSGSPTAPGGGLPTTGAGVAGLALLALGLAAAGLWLRRRAVSS